MEETVNDTFEHLNFKQAEMLICARATHRCRHVRGVSRQLYDAVYNQSNRSHKWQCL